MKLQTVINIIFAIWLAAATFSFKPQFDIGGILSDIAEIAQNHENRLSAVEDTLAIEDVKLVTITAYTPSKDECNNSPFITASMEIIRPGTVAVSRDLFKAGWIFGKKVYIEGHGIYQILDLMNERWTNRIDIVMFSKDDAISFGIKDNRAAALLRI